MKSKILKNRLNSFIKEYPKRSGPFLCKKYNIKRSYLDFMSKKFKLRKIKKQGFIFKKGERIGNIIIVRKTNKKQKNNTMYLVKCDCGISFLARSSILNKRKIDRCNKCSIIKNIGRKHHNSKGYEKISGTTWNKILSHAHERGIKVKITVKQAYELYEKQKGKCALSGVKIFFSEFFKQSENTASLDRIDKNKDYIIGNVQWVHKKVNFMKHSMTESDFIYFCKKITRYNERKNCEKRHKTQRNRARFSSKNR